MPGKNTCITVIWTAGVEEKFNDISIGEVFRHPGLSLVVGCEDGVVRIYELPSLETSGNAGSRKVLKLKSSLETKGGPIQKLALHDVTKFYSNDVVVVDSRGTVTVFCNEQMLCHKAVSEQCIHCLQVESNALGNIAIVTSDGAGHVAAFNPYADLWRIRLTDIKQLRGLGMTPYIHSLLSVDLMNAAGQKTNYLVATDNCRHLYLIHQGSVVMVTNTPAVITAMAAGKFVRPEDIEVPASANFANDMQVALGSEHGAIYIMYNFKVFQDEIANVRLPLTHMAPLPSDGKDTDSLICAGNFNGLVFIQDGKEYARYETPAWINSLATKDINGDGQLEVVLGCCDSSIHAIKIGT